MSARISGPAHQSLVWVKMLVVMCMCCLEPGHTVALLWPLPTDVGIMQIDACLHSKHVFASHMHPAAHAAGGSLRSMRVDLFLDAVVSSTSTCVALQLQAALGNACTIFPTIDLAVPIPEEERAAHIADCQSFMGGLLMNGEVASMRYFMQLARTTALRVLKRAAMAPAVRQEALGVLSNRVCVRGGGGAVCCWVSVSMGKGSVLVPGNAGSKWCAAGCCWI